MSVKNIVAIADLKANYFMSPVTVRHTSEALRSVSDEANQAGSSLGKHPADFALYHIADFDEDTGLVTPKNPPIQLALVSALVDNKE